VLASSPAPRAEDLSVETANFTQLKQMAENGNAAAENALGLRYFQGDEKDNIAPDEGEAVRWFNKAAVHGNLAAQAKLGSLYWSGRGVAKDVNQAYFWTVLARARGDEQSRDLATILASGMTRSQSAAIEQQADVWLQQHMPTWKPSAGH
jgi:TPR repeat protein